MSDSEIIDCIKRRDESWVKPFYRSTRTDFIKWIASKFSINSEDVIEIFQATMVIFYENIRTGKYVEMNSSLKTYFFAVGRNKALEYLSRKKKEGNFSLRDYVIHENTWEDEPDTKNENERVILKTAEILKRIGKPCYPIIRMFYYENKKWIEIAKELGYKTENSAKNMKYKCLQKIRKLLIDEGILNKMAANG